jgi:hypothetical protein
MKRCNGSLLKRHNGSMSYPLEDYINIKYGERKMCLWSNSEYLNRRHSPRKNLKHETSHEVRVEGRSKGGLESSTGWSPEQQRVATSSSWCLKTKDWSPLQVGA